MREGDKGGREVPYSENKVLKWQLAELSLLMPRALESCKRVGKFVAPHWTSQISAQLESKTGIHTNPGKKFTRCDYQHLESSAL